MKYGLSRSNDFYRPWSLLGDFEHGLGSLLVDKNFVPAVDFFEDDEGFHLSMDLPGVSKNDVSIEVKHGILTARGKRESSRKEGGFSEKCYGRFERSFTLPKSADGDKVQAKFENGVLGVTIAKKEEVRAKKIEIS